MSKLLSATDRVALQKIRDAWPGWQRALSLPVKAGRQAAAAIDGKHQDAQVVRLGLVAFSERRFLQSHRPAILFDKRYFNAAKYS